MKNSITIAITHATPKKRANPITEQYNNLLKEFESKQIGYSAIAVLGISCMASIAVMLIMMHHMPILFKMIAVFLVTIFSAGFMTSVLAQLRLKLRFNLLLLSLVFSTMVIIINLF